MFYVPEDYPHVSIGTPCYCSFYIQMSASTKTLTEKITPSGAVGQRILRAQRS